jgi:tRNA(fMet)-specific endonuclease VapC
MGLILDTSVFVASERGRFDLQAFIDAEEDTSMSISAVTASELLVGLRLADAGHATRRSAFIEYVLATFPVVPFDLRAGEVRAGIASQLLLAGTAIGALDLIIAATAMADGHEVATRDLRSFPRIPGLRVRAV